MAFKRTSEGRVFFKNTEDDTPPPNGILPIDIEPSRSDQSQMQILILLKSLNAKLMDTQEERTLLKEDLAKYRQELKNLEEKATRSEKSYLDLEQKIASKQNEAFKKTSRVEETIKETAKELERARNIVEALEGKSQDSETILKSLREDMSQRRKLEDEIIALQKNLENQQLEHAEKLTENMSTIVALTKRVGDTEARQEALDNKIEEATTEFLKLDRKINKAIEDRSRLLRKLERMEESVQETREALNTKAMVFLTGQGKLASADMAQIEGGLTLPAPEDQADGDIAREPRPFWSRPFQIDASSMVMIIVIGLLLGWMISELKAPPREHRLVASEKITWNQNRTPELKTQDKQDIAVASDTNISEPLTQEKTAEESLPLNNEQPAEDTQTTSDEIKQAIIRGDEKTLLSAFEENPDALAQQLNEIEPSSLVSTDLKEPTEEATPEAEQEPQENLVAPVIIPEKPPIAAQTEKTAKTVEETPKSLREVMAPDKSLPEQIRKIEEQAYDGKAEAQHDMGALYIAGREPVKKDMKRAVFWFEEAAKNGIANAKYNLGVLYHQGLGVDADLNKALDLYSQAADLNHPEAQYNLGIAYIGGIGYAYDPIKAAANFESAANAGVMEAAYNLGLIYENGLLGKPQPDEALMWYREAADKNSPEAKAALDQLAQSLGISIEEVNRIVDAVRAAKKKEPIPSTSQKKSQGNSEANNKNYSSAGKKISSPAPYPDTGVSKSVEPDSRENTIAGIQTELMRRGLYPGPVDGKIGPVTSDAIKTYQSAANMQVIDGKPSQSLLDFMRSGANVEQGSASE